MRKEVIFAIILGIALGAIILYGSQIANQAAKDAALPQNPVESLIAATPTSTPSPTLTKNLLTITKPQNNFVSASSELDITGKAPAKTTLALISESDEQIIETDAEGNFASIVTLIGGENEITITGLIDNQPQSVSLTVIYSSAEIK